MASSSRGPQVKRLMEIFAQMKAREEKLAYSPCVVYNTTRVIKKPKCSFRECDRETVVKCPYCDRFFCDQEEHVSSLKHIKRCRAYGTRVLNTNMIEVCAARSIRAGQFLYQDYALLEYPNHSYGAVQNDQDVLGDRIGFTSVKTTTTGNILIGKEAEILAHSPVCFGCQCLRKKCQLVCSKCKIPLCCKKCELEPAHFQNECKVITDLNMDLENLHSSMSTFHLDIATVRAIISYNSDKSSARCKWHNLTKVSRFANFKQGRNYQLIFGNASLEMTLPISMAASKNRILVEKLACVICAFSDTYPWNSTCSAIYPGLAVLEHSCTPNIEFQWMNAYPTMDKNCSKEPETVGRINTSSISLISTKAIAKGATLTANFCFRPLAGRLERKAILHRKSVFNCRCVLCIDPTDGGTFANAIRCKNQSCVLGYLLPTDTANSEVAAWSCHFCHQEESAKTIQETHLQAASELANVDPATLCLLEQFQRKWSIILHPNHYILIACKKKMLQCSEKFMLTGSSMLLISVLETAVRIFRRNPELEFCIQNYQLKRDYCCAVLRHLNLTCPGINWRRAFVLRELFFTNFLILLWETKMAKEAYKGSDPPKGVVVQFYRDISRGIKMLNESCEIIMKSFGSHTQQYALAKKSLIMVSNLNTVCGEIRHRDYVPIQLLRRYLFSVAQAMLVHDPPTRGQESLLAHV